MINKILVIILIIFVVIIGGEWAYLNLKSKPPIPVPVVTGTPNTPSVPSSPALLDFIDSLKSDTTQSIVVTIKNEGVVGSYGVVNATEKIAGGSDKDIKIVLKSARGQYYDNNIYLNQAMLQRTSIYEMKGGKEASSSADRIKAGQKIDIISTIDALKMDTTQMKIVILE